MTTGAVAQRQTTSLQAALQQLDAASSVHSHRAHVVDLFGHRGGGRA